MAEIQDEASKIPFPITIELEPENAEEWRLLNVSRLGQNFIRALPRSEYTVLYDGDEQVRGVDTFIVHVLIELTSAATYLWDQRAAIEEGVQFAGTTISVCTGIVSLLKHLKEVQKKQPDGDAQGIAFTVEVDGKKVTVQASELEDAEAAVKLARRLLETAPAGKQITSKSKAKVHGRVSQAPGKYGR
ncbi:hypothetical protein [Dictyobacter aurantiacus]|uniref:Uncharacterized protein n=1 Tax=Dictyobacter aurantiacus TaxID=1936993 RepID=A0A401ZMX5_9CHLR|nr:hypothetical protein [Dictyobacter aurantiacus]GCE08227.1 hypothetical protein KDAU_55560 [Dictyobacter aurantiacus]